MKSNLMTEIVPLPEYTELLPGQFKLKPSLNVSLTGVTPDAAQLLLHRLQRASAVTFTQDSARQPDLQFKLDSSRSDLGEEGSELHIEPDTIVLRAATPAGLFYATISLQQLLWSASHGVLQCQHILDRPRFRWRGLMLDVVRHFMPMDALLRWLEQLALLKLNTFHWHLTDDQGWRIPIAQYPKLTEVGSVRPETLIGHLLHHKPWQYNGTPHQGFYTREEIQRVLDFAQERFITVIPEIDLPGHAQAALAAYPEFGSGAPSEVMTRWGISERLFHPRKETLTFLKNVLTEVAGMFPGPYVCIGGDECPVTEWEESAEMQTLVADLGLSSVKGLHGYLVREVAEHLRLHGKKVCGWEEILHDDLPGDAAVLIWLHEEKAREAVQAGYPTVVCTHQKLYLDYYQSDRPEQEPLAQGEHLPLEEVYRYDPVPAGLSDAERQRVLGVQANMWTEYFPTPEQVEYMMFPRLCAVAELAWTPQRLRNFEDFRRRLSAHLTLLDREGIKYRPLELEAPQSVLAEKR
jgi:hexosaminidase